MQRVVRAIQEGLIAGKQKHGLAMDVLSSKVSLLGLSMHSSRIHRGPWGKAVKTKTAYQPKKRFRSEATGSAKEIRQAHGRASRKGTDGGIGGHMRIGGKKTAVKCCLLERMTSFGRDSGAN